MHNGGGDKKKPLHGCRGKLMSELISIEFLVEHHPTIDEQRLAGHVVGIRSRQV